MLIFIWSRLLSSIKAAIHNLYRWMLKNGYCEQQADFPAVPRIGHWKKSAFRYYGQIGQDDPIDNVRFGFEDSRHRYHRILLLWLFPPNVEGAL